MLYGYCTEGTSQYKINKLTEKKNKPKTKTQTQNQNQTSFIQLHLETSDNVNTMLLALFTLMLNQKWPQFWNCCFQFFNMPYLWCFVRSA